MNKAMIIGRFVADPELKETAGGLNVTRFTLAVDRRYGKTKEDHETDWIDVVAWRGLAEFVCKYFEKGSPIYIEGSIQTKMWEDKEGNKRKAVEVHAENAEFLPKTRELTGAGSGKMEFTGAGVGQVQPIVPKEVYTINQSFAQGGNDDFQQVNDEDLPF